MGCKRAEDTEQTTAPRTGETGKYWEPWLTKAETPARPRVRQQNLNCSWWIAGGSWWTSLRVKGSKGSSYRVRRQDMSTLDIIVKIFMRPTSSNKQKCCRRQPKRPTIFDAKWPYSQLGTPVWSRLAYLTQRKLIPTGRKALTTWHSTEPMDGQSHYWSGIFDFQRWQ